ncbi:MAG: hypothetical protein E4H08_07865 [Candidatus Atribacteria bacterium]|nr:MAG: hypothetical protein E4H08_07865 [Candidatus Atribacteria bacterium]
MRDRTLKAAGITAMLVALGFSLMVVAETAVLGSFENPFTTLFASGELAYPGELDWYTFDVVGDAMTVRLQAEGSGSDGSIRALLFGDDETYIDSTQSGYLTVPLVPGAYRIRVDSLDSAVQSYSLVVFNGMEVESNDGVIESNDLGYIEGPTRLAASLLPVGDADFFRFDVPQDGLAGDANALLIETSGRMGGDTAITLYRFSDIEDRYMPILFDDDSGEEVWSQLLAHPEPGDRFVLRAEETYYPLVGIDDYEIAITPITLVMDAEPNNTSAQAIDLISESPGSASRRADGVLASGDTVDFFRIVIGSSALIQIATDPQSNAGDYDTLITLYAANGDRLAQNDNGGASSWSRIAMALDAGDYYIAVERATYGAVLIPYRLSVNALAMNLVAETEPNDTDEMAETITWTGGEALMIEATIGVDGDVDSFRLVLAEDATLVVETGPAAGLADEFDTTLSIYDVDLWEIASNDDANGTWSRIEETLAAGTYYIVVESFFGDESFAYTLLITDEGGTD